MNELEITPGKFYRTRDGQKVRIYAVDGKGSYLIHGAILRNDYWSIMAWTSDRKFFSSGFPAQIDIIGLWHEPLDFLWATDQTGWWGYCDGH